MKISKILTVIIPLTFTFSSHAAMNEMKPGLWENTFTIKSQSGKVEKAMADLKSKMASMPAEQRKMMEEMMAKQGLGVSQEANTVKVCISKEQAKNMEIPQGQNQNCTHEIVNRTNNSVKMKFDCKGTRETSGEGEFTLTSPTAYTGKSIVNTTLDGKQDRMDMTQKGKWLSSDCGEIKSLQSKK
jgi:major membrane immunogen (membrane-anchored lipoprotein)